MFFQPTPNETWTGFSEHDRVARSFFIGLLVLAVALLSNERLYAQRTPATRKLPSADKVVEKYLKALGGKKRVATIRDATYEWTVHLNGQQIGVGTTQIKSPASSRSELTFANGRIITAANSSSAWSKGLDGELRTLTGAEGGVAKLQSLLNATHLINYKKNNVAARVLSLDEQGNEPAYVVEFSTRSGARLLYFFNQATGLISKVQDESRKTNTTFAEYRPLNGFPTPHLVKIDLQGTGELTLQLQKSSYNSGVLISTFDAPSATQSLSVEELLREVGRNQDEVEKRFTEYSFRQKETDKEINSKGEVKKQTERVYEVFPLAYREPVLKLISENGVPLSEEKAAKEEKRVQEELVKAERDREKNEAKEMKRRAERQQKRAAKGQTEDEDVEISQFLKVCEFVSPRRERFRDREAVVFDFRPRPGFRPRNRQEELISKLVGVVWIDPADKQVMRLEARLAEGFKMAGGLLFSLRPGASLVMEQTRMQEGIWLPKLAQINLSMKVLLFGGGDLNKTYEWSDYKHFKGDVGDYRLDAPGNRDERVKTQP